MLWFKLLAGLYLGSFLRVVFVCSFVVIFGVAFFFGLQFVIFGFMFGVFLIC